MSKNLVVGGEFYFNCIKQGKYAKLDEIILDQKGEYQKFGLFLGGYYSLKWILRDIKKTKQNYEILLPSYLCSSIVEAVRSEGIPYSFYKVSENFKIDIKSIETLLNGKNTVLYMINYFGFEQNICEIEFLKQLREIREVQIIEDNVQSCFSQIDHYGDYVFNSFKKWSPIDGSIVYSNRQVTSSNSIHRKYIVARKIMQLHRCLQLEYNMPFEKMYLKWQMICSKLYYSNIIYGMPVSSKRMFSDWNIDYEKDVRRMNFLKLLDCFKNVAVFKYLPTNTVPLNFPILLVERDMVIKKLMREGIFCSIHWKLPREIIEQFPTNYNLSKEILNIPINKLLSQEMIEKMYKIISEHNNEFKNSSTQ